MESRFKILGHPVHPVLVVFPLGLLVTAAVMDAVAFQRESPPLSAVAHYNIGIGLLIGVVAASFGWLDWLAIPDRTRAKRVGAAHGVANMVAVVLFGIVWAQRQGTADVTISGALLTVEILGLAVLLVGGWLGGELVDRLGVGVDENAHLNAPNSLLHSPPARPEPRRAAQS